MYKTIDTLYFWEGAEPKIILNLIQDEYGRRLWMHPCSFEKHETATYFIVKEGLAIDEEGAIEIFKKME